MPRESRKIGRSRGGGKSRGQLVAETLRVAELLRSGALTVEEAARTTRIHPRTVYRILEALEEAGYLLEVSEEPRKSGRGRPYRRYHLDAVPEVAR